MRRVLMPVLAAGLLLVLLHPAPSRAGDDTAWLEFPQSAFRVGVDTTLTTAAGTLVNVTVQTGGTHGVSGTDLDTLGVSETGLGYSHLFGLTIFDGGGHVTVPTSLTFSNIRVGSAHQEGLLMVGAVNGLSSPVTVTSSVAGRVATWTVVGEPFAFGPSNSAPIAWDPSSGQLTTNAAVGNDSRCIVVGLGDLRNDGTIVVSLAQYLDDGIVVSFGEQLTGPLAVPAPLGGLTLALAKPRPNPATMSATLAFTLPVAGRARLAVYDAVGRRLATLADADFTAGVHVLTWDLRDRAGARVRPGLVLVRLELPGATRTVRLLVVS